MLDAYVQRDAILKKHGYANYKSYLASALWRKIRDRVLKANDGQCLLCGEKATQVHHTNYREDTLFGRDESGLVPLCDPCHHLGEYGTDGSKVPLEIANARLRLLKEFVGFGNESVDDRRRRLVSNMRCYRQPKQRKPKTPEQKQAKAEKTMKKIEERKALPGRCKGCGNEAKQGTDLCRKCRREAKPN